MAYPDDIDTFRLIENLPGLVYDPLDKRTFFTEDLQAVRTSVLAVENIMGTTPQGAYATVKAWLTALASAISGKQDALGFTAENVANKDTTVTLGVSDTKYPSQAAVKSYVDALAAKMQSGWTYGVGDGTALYVVGTVTFATAFASVPIVLLTPIGWRSTGTTPTNPGQFTFSHMTAGFVAAHAYNISTTGFSWIYRIYVGIPTNQQQGVAWIARL